jgi:hypothetical protein
MRDGWKITGPNDDGEYVWTLRGRDGKRTVARVLESNDVIHGFVVLKIFLRDVLGCISYYDSMSSKCNELIDRSYLLHRAMYLAEVDSGFREYNEQDDPSVYFSILKFESWRISQAAKPLVGAIKEGHET